MGFMKRPKLPPVTPIAPVTPAPTPADERKSAAETERALMKKYDSGRASTVLTGSGANNKLG